MPEPRGEIHGVATDGRFIVSGGSDGLIRLFAMDADEPSSTASIELLETWRHSRIDGEHHEVYTVGIHASDRTACTVASGGHDDAARAWRVALDCGVSLLWGTDTTGRGHHNWVRKVLVTDDLLVSASLDNTVLVSGLETGRVHHTLSHPDWAIALAVDGAVCATGCDDGFVRMWDLGSGKLMRCFDTGHHVIRAIALRGDLLATGSGVTGYDRPIRLWSLRVDTAVVAAPPAPTRPPTSIFNAQPPATAVGQTATMLSDIGWNEGEHRDQHVPPGSDHGRRGVYGLAITARTGLVVAAPERGPALLVFAPSLGAQPPPPVPPPPSHGA